MNHLDELTLYEYLDGELAAAASQAVIAHLDTCPECQASLVQAQTLYTTLSELPEQSLTRDLAPAVLNAIRQGTRPVVPWWWVWVLLAEGFAAALLSLILRPNLFPPLPTWIPPLSTALSLDGLSRLFLTGWSELQQIFTLTWPALPPVILAVPLMAWPGILGLALLVGILGNGLLWRMVLSPISPPSQRGKHV